MKIELYQIYLIYMGYNPWAKYKCFPGDGFGTPIIKFSAFNTLRNSADTNASEFVDQLLN